MLPSRWLALLFGALLALAGTGTPALAGCEKTVVVREGPDGKKQPHRLVRCDETTTPGLLAGNAHLTLCDPKALAASGARFEDCVAAVDAARTALRQAKIRAALRDGKNEEEIAQTYGATPMELEALRPPEVAQ